MLKDIKRDVNIPSRRCGRATGLAKVTATKDKRATTVNCMFAVLTDKDTSQGVRMEGSSGDNF